MNNREGGKKLVLCVCVCVCVRVCAQVADTLGKSFQIHLFRSLCADDTCTTLPKKCHSVSDFVCSYDPRPPQLACMHACVRMCLCVSMYILCLNLQVDVFCIFMLGAQSNVLFRRRNNSRESFPCRLRYCCAAFNDSCLKSSFSPEDG